MPRVSLWCGMTLGMILAAASSTHNWDDVFTGSYYVAGAMLVQWVCAKWQ